METALRSWLAGIVGAVFGALALEGAERLEGLLHSVRPSPPPVPGWATTCFTPPEDCTTLIAEELGRAERQVLVQAYSFTSVPIADALVAARRRGVEVRVLLDADSAEGPASVVAKLARARVQVLLDDPSGIAHNKVMVIDGARVITGSFNFTRSAEERNAENLIVLRDPAIAGAYAANWEARRARSDRYAPQQRP